MIENLDIYNFKDNDQEDDNQIISDLKNSEQKKINSKHFYDEKGSKLFDKISELKEYYPTRTELEIIENIVIAINPTGSIAIASIYALIGTLMWSTTIIFLRLLGTTEHPVKTVFYFMLVSFILTSFFQPFLWKEPSLRVILLFIGLGVSAFLTQLLMTYALQKAPASIVSPFNYTGIVWAIIFDYLIWNSHPIISTIVGGFIITISGIYIFKREAKIKSIK